MRLAVAAAGAEGAWRADMVEPDGRIHVKCEYCARDYEIAPETLAEVEA